MNPDPNPIAAFIPLIIMSIPFAIVGNLLAKEKGRNVFLWTVIAIIPFINFIAMWFFVGATNLRLEQKLDMLLEHKLQK